MSVIKSHVGNGQTVGDNHRYQDSNVVIVAQKWVKEGLEIVANSLPKNTVLEVYDHSGKQTVVPISGQLSLKLLQQMARNESSHNNGNIEMANYGPGIDQSLVYALKDLVRQCVIVGSDWTTHFGGFPKSSARRPQKELVFVCDLSGLQFQNNYNSGRLVLIGHDLPKGLLDDFIYEKVVQQKKPTLKEAANDRTGRFVKCRDVYFDTEAYHKFVANDVLTCGLALDKCATEPLNFKFLRYGCGFFAGPYKDLLTKHIGEGVAQGLELLLPRDIKIEAIELPFYEKNSRIENICRRHDIEVKFSTDDALKRTHPRYVTATTDCVDPHSSTGNKSGFGSIHASIVENLEGKAIKFSPSINRDITELFLEQSVNNLI